jgi:hypothetical protein
MAEEEKKDTPKDFGKVIDALHSKQKLPSLRTYQGDMAEFIKERNESVISIAVKEKEKERKTEENISLAPKPAVKKEGLKINLTMLLLSILLLAGGTVAFLYIYQFIKKGPTTEVVLETKIIPYNNLITLSDVTNKSLGPELAKLPAGNGISVLKISDANGLALQKSRDFLNFLGVSLPPTLERTLKDEYAVGAFSQDNQTSLFLVISVNDFGQAFSGMLDWEGNMAKDLSFFNVVASTTVPMRPESLSWQDIIVKNKDTRGLVNSKNQAKIAYTFLDKNTVLITNNLSAIGDISSLYASRSVAR